MITIVDSLVIVLATSSSYWLYKTWILPSSKEPSSDGYIIKNTVQHGRLIPAESAHSFTYPTLSLLLSVQSLDSGSLNLGYGRVFGVGKRPWTRIVGLRPAAYLMDDGIETKSFRSRLDDVLEARGLSKTIIHDVWILTSPSYLGFEGINPLTVWFGYDKELNLKLLVLEVHNTFGERHVYILEVGVSEDESVPQSFDHQWTFPREFHVSPFNDRTGYYVCSIGNTLHPSLKHPMPIVRINYLTPSTRRLKLSASMRAIKSVPFGTANLLSTLATSPFILMLSLIRISYQASILHFKKRLDVYARPEPRAVNPNIESSLRKSWNDPQNAEGIGGAVGWQPAGLIERVSRQVVESFIQQRVEELPIEIQFLSSNSFDPPRIYKPTSLKTQNLLKIYYRSPRLFSIMLITPSASHALLLGSKAERIFNTSDDSLFNEFFEPPARTRLSRLQRLRVWLLPSNAPRILYPPVHFLDNQRPLLVVPVLLAYYLLELLERSIYIMFKARFVEGDEPWNGWGRLDRKEKPIDIGSVRRKD